MAGNESGDLLMMVLSSPGKAIAAESVSKLIPYNPLLKGFKEGRMFEISDFQFGVATLTEPKSGSSKDSNNLLAGLANLKGLTPQLRNAAVKIGKGVAPPNAPQGDAKSCPVEPVTFSRPIDDASTELMQHCIESTTLHGAVVVKRKPAGGPASGETYLRLEFIDVLFTDVAWSNGDIIEERCTFITRAVNILYRPQLPDGTLGAVKSGFWSRKAASQGEQLSYPS